MVSQCDTDSDTDTSDTDRQKLHFVWPKLFECRPSIWRVKTKASGTSMQELGKSNALFIIQNRQALINKLVAYDYEQSSHNILCKSQKKIMIIFIMETF